jgi:hypothetical protein
MEKPARKPNPKREELLRLSAQARELKERLILEAKDENEAFYWATKTLNFLMLRYFYHIPEKMEMNTFHQWKEKGYLIKKGEKGTAIWGQPLRAQREQANPEEESESGGMEYFPMCFLFSKNQVLSVEEIEEEKAKAAKKQADKKEMQEAINNFDPVNIDLVF